MRREISSQGRSRSFINGALATAGALRDLSDRLVELHGQHEHQALLDPVTHLPLLDEFAGHHALVQTVADAWAEVRRLREQLDRSQMNGREKAARLELIAFQLGEIEKSAPKPGEDEELAATKQVLASADRVQRLCEESYAALYDSDSAVLASLGTVWKRVGELAAIEPQFAPYAEARDSIKSQLEDLAYFLRRYADGVDASPARLQEVEDRLATLERLKRKYGPTLADVIDRGDQLARERSLLSGDGDRAEDLQVALASASEAFLGAARDLSRRRRKHAALFAGELETLLAELAMARTKFEVRFNELELPPESWSERGIDQAEFYISPNVGETPRPLAKIVSGGELSRVMLGLKTIGATRQTPNPGRNPGGHPVAKTLIFDEVDAGIGGRVADVVGARLAQLGDRFQVLCITHLPQIAARASTQFLIEKSVRGTRTVTTVAKLDPDVRVDEIARMIGGASVTDAVRQSARDLLAGTGRAKANPKAKGESESRRRG